MPIVSHSLCIDKVVIVKDSSTVLVAISPWLCFQPSQNTSDVGSLSDQLARATVDEKTLLDFSGSGLKLNSGADGEWPVTQSLLKLET